MPRRAVLFDLDATLMDHDAARIAGFATHLAEWLPDTQASELERLDEEWRRLEALHYEQYSSGECSAAEQRRRRVRGMHDLLGHALPSDAEADAWFASYLGHYRAQWRAFEDVAPALEGLCAVQPELVLGVVTNGEGEPQRAKLAAIGVADRFTAVIASGEVGFAKPDAAIFALACERLGVQPAHAAHVGDRLDLDAQAASAAGLHGIWLDRLGTQHAPRDVTRIATLRELSAVLSS
jgi:putative hydrolase of the HAD superfamily